MRVALSRLAAVVVLSVATAGVTAVPASAADIIAEWTSVKAPPPPALKAVTVDPNTTALLLMDFLPKFYCAEKPRCVATLPAMKKLLDSARSADVTVIYSVSGKFTAADIEKAIAPKSGEPVVSAHADKFIGTDLGELLKHKGIKTVIVTGTAANGAVLYTGSHAALLGMNVIVPVDGLSSENLYAEQLTVWQLADGPGFGKQVTITRSDMIKF